MKIINCFRQRARKYSKKTKGHVLKYPGIGQVKKQDLVTVNKSASLGYQPSQGKYKSLRVDQCSAVRKFRISI